jgi:hypothetical protein
MTALTLVTALWLASAQGAPTASQEVWLKSLPGTWVVDGAVGSDADVTLAVSREGKFLVLKMNIQGREVVTRYDLTGADVRNEGIGYKPIYRTRIDGEKLVTQIWLNEAVGAPQSIETRYLAPKARMVTELAKTLGAPAFIRTVMRQKGGSLLVCSRTAVSEVWRCLGSRTRV